MKYICESQEATCMNFKTHIIGQIRLFSIVCSSLCFNGATNTKTLYLLIIVNSFPVEAIKQFNSKGK